MKKTLSIILSICMLLSITAGIKLTAYAETDGEFEYSVSDGKATITRYTGLSTIVSIPANVNEYVVTSIGYNAFGENERITDVIIPNSVISIGERAFKYCKKLANISLPDSLTTIGKEAFFDCDSLKTIVIPDSVTEIDGSAFSCCSELVDIVISNNNQNLTLNNGVLFNKSKTKIIFYPPSKSDTSYVIPNTVTSIDDYTFTYSTNLQSVTIPKSVTSIGQGLFQNCEELNNVIIYAELTNIPWGTFIWCENLQSLTLPSTITDIAYGALRGCDGLRHVYFTGTKKQWNNIIIGEDSAYYLSFATIHCSDGNIQPTCEHTHSLVSIPSKPATCNESGNNAYYYCTDCEKCFKDEAGTQETTVSAETIPATGNHTPDKGRITKKATPTATGTKVYTCTLCGQTIKTETIIKTAKYNNTLNIKAKKPTVKYSKLKKKNQTIALKNAMNVSKAKGTVTYKKLSGNKKITVNKKTGKFTVKKGLKKGTYKVKIKINAAGNASYKAVSKTVMITLIVK